VAIWEEAARWLAAFHTRMARVNHLGQAPNLLRYDADFYRTWMQRVQAFGPGLQPLIRVYDRLVARLLALPTTLIHGEFYASNVLVQHTTGGVRICPVDWETTALGPGLMDLAALTAGDWPEEASAAMVGAYQRALPAGIGLPSGPEAFLEALDCCRLHQAVQWLGWSADWSPPTEHVHDWRREALRLAEKLGLTGS
jgi:aminoglycoside/choline kinase family phosphotransferase